jgi:hypothetical protein
MPGNFIAQTTYFLQEGRENLEECLKVAFQAAQQHGVEKIVIFTARGEGVQIALRDFCSQPQYRNIRLVAVTFPADKHFTDSEKKPIAVEIPSDVMSLFEANKVPIVRAHLPFDSVEPGAAQRTHVGRAYGLVGEALNMFCGSMSLCVQAIALACDAGYVLPQEHVISVTSDTAILASAAVTRKMLSKLVIREILCKPAILTIGRNETAPMVLEGGEPGPTKQLTNSAVAENSGKKMIRH